MPLPDPPLHVVLVHPEIPPNTGNVARTCAVTGCQLHLIEPLGFRIDDRELRRAGLDYWNELQVQVWTSLGEYLESTPAERRWYCTTKGTLSMAEAPYERGDHLLFGSETTGLPPALITSNAAQTIRIPMRPSLRSLNLSNATAVVVYAALGRMGYPGME